MEGLKELSVLLTEGREDAELDHLDLDLESLNTSKLYNKWLTYGIQYSAFLDKTSAKRDTMIKEKTDYYMGKSDPEVYSKRPFNRKVIKADLPLYMNSDPEIQEMNKLIGDINRAIKFIEQTARDISSRNYYIKNAIEWRKFQVGQ